MIAGGNQILDQLAGKAPTGAGFVLSVDSFPCSGTHDDASKLVEAVVSVVETESSVVAVFLSLGTEADTSKVVEAAASVVAVSMLTSGVCVVDADESTLWSTTFFEGLVRWFKAGVALIFSLLNISSVLRECLVAPRWYRFFPYLMKRKNAKNWKMTSKDYEFMLKLFT